MLLAEQLPSPSSEPQSIEEEIGRTVSAAVGALSYAILSHMADGKLSPAARARGAEALAELYVLRRDNPGIGDFEEVCRVRGKKALRAWLAAQSNPPKVTENSLDWLIGWILTLHREVFHKRIH
jgi:hypothetical protein